MRVQICRKCVLPSNFPRVVFDDKGVCDKCREYEKIQGEAAALKKEYRNRFERLIRSVIGKAEYDILMCYSGGKDSTYALSLLKKKYGLDILAFTFDNGFLADGAYKNIRRVVEALDVDHLFFKPRFSVLRKIFRAGIKGAFYPEKALERASTICTSCVGLLKYMALKTAIDKGIPLIGFGWSPGQAPVTSSILQLQPAMVRGMEGIIRTPLRKIAGDDIDAYFLTEKQYKAGGFPVFVHPLAVHGYNEKKILKHIAKMGWRKPYGLDYNATNCLLNSFADEVHMAKYKFHPYASEIAVFVREGYMTRAEGLRHLPVKKNKKVVREVKRRLGVD